MHLRYGGFFNNYFTAFPAECISKRITNIKQHLVNIWTRVRWLFFDSWFTGWLKTKCPTRQNAISQQPIQIFPSKFHDLKAKYFQLKCQSLDKFKYLNTLCYFCVKVSSSSSIIIIIILHNYIT